MKNLVQRSGEAARKQESHSIISFDNGKLLFSKKKIPLQMRCQGAGIVKIECPLEREALSVFKVLHQTNSMFSQKAVIWGYILKARFLGHNQVLHC